MAQTTPTTPAAISEPTQPTYKSNKQSGITWGQWLGEDDCPYMRRWVVNTGRCSLRLHQWFGSDDDRAFHDHPWWFITLVLRGGYTDVSPIICPTCQGREATNCPGCRASSYPAGTIGIRRQRLGRGWRRMAFRPALHRHTVEVDPGGALTLLLTGPVIRKWGFWHDGQFIGVRKYFRRFGHHPCQN